MAAGQSAAYMLIFRDTTPEVYEGMTNDDRRLHLDRWNAWLDEVAASGRMVAGDPLEDERIVVSASRGGKAVDGPYAEAKELVGGYVIVKAGGIEEARAVAERCPLLPFGMTVEVRPVAGACHLARALGWETMRAPEMVQ